MHLKRSVINQNKIGCFNVNDLESHSDQAVRSVSTRTLKAKKYWLRCAIDIDVSQVFYKWCEDVKACKPR